MTTILKEYIRFDSPTDQNNEQVLTGDPAVNRPNTFTGVSILSF